MELALEETDEWACLRIALSSTALPCLFPPEITECRLDTEKPLVCSPSE